MSTTATLSSKGQIVIPAAVRTEMGLTIGSRVEFITSENGWLLRPVATDISALRGVLRKPRKPVSLTDMDAAIAARLRARNPRKSPAKSL
jgi:antitoxin PrlF